jgi:hypothetical protein
MYYSKKLSLLFIASPKNGSMSVQKHLMQIDPEGETHSLTMYKKKITSKDMPHGIVGHARAWEFKKVLGEEFYNSLRVIGFVRHPFDKLISSYYFNKQSSLSSSFTVKTKKNSLTKKIKMFTTLLAPKILPLNIWVLIFPMKSSYEYFFDKSGNRIVSHLGRTDNLIQDLKIILDNLQISTSIKIPHINKSNHKSRDQYFKNKWIRKRLFTKFKKDIELYYQVEKELKELQGKVKV